MMRFCEKLGSLHADLTPTNICTNVCFKKLRQSEVVIHYLLRFVLVLLKQTLFDVQYLLHILDFYIPMAILLNGLKISGSIKGHSQTTLTRQGGPENVNGMQIFP